MNFVPRQGTRKKSLKKNYFLPSKFPQIWRNSQDFGKFLNSYDFPPDLGKYPSFGAKSITKRSTQIAEVILEHKGQSQVFIDFIGVIDDSCKSF